jgi:murein DD-endopeptidase MepM/ murein hydrolase activator NlpD
MATVAVVMPTVEPVVSKPEASITPIEATMIPISTVEPATPTTKPTIATIRPTETVATPEPAITPTKSLTTAVNTVSPIVGSDGMDRTCPDPAPQKPDYRHYLLSGQTWPQPVENPGGHFWLSKPLPGGGRLLYTDWFPYGYDAGGRYLIHNGIDVAEPLATPLLSAADGTVVVAGSDENLLYGWRCDWYGNLVAIELDEQWLGQPVYLVYGHVLNILVEVGQQVVRGQQIAEVGVGGAARFPHMHFEVRVGTNEFSSTRNPFLWLELPVSRGLVIGRLVDPLGRPWQGVSITAVGRSEGTENITTWSYLDDPQHLINPDELFAENFVIPDLRPGSYELYIELQGQQYLAPIEVFGGQSTRVEIITEPYKTPIPDVDNENSEQATDTAPDED